MATRNDRRRIEGGEQRAKGRKNAKNDFAYHLGKLSNQKVFQNKNIII